MGHCVEMRFCILPTLISKRAAWNTIKFTKCTTNFYRYRTLIPHWWVTFLFNEICWNKAINSSIYLRHMFNTWNSQDVPKVSNQLVLSLKRHVKTSVHGIMYLSPLHSWNTIAARIKMLPFVFSNWDWKNSAAIQNMSNATSTICRIWMVSPSTA